MYQNECKTDLVLFVVSVRDHKNLECNMKSPSSRELRSKKQVNNQNKREEMDNTTSSKRKNATLTTRKKRPQQKRVDALSEADSNCSDVINKFLVKNSEEVLASAENFHKPAIKDTTTSSSATKETPTSETPTSVTSKAPTSATSETPTSETSTSGTVTTTTPSAFTIDSSNNELDLKHYMLGGSDITALFRQYQNRADKILRPIILETYVQELLALGDVLFLAKNQHSNIKTSFFSEELLDKLLDNQNQVLLNKIPDTCPDFTTEDYMTVLKVLTSIDQNIITPKQAKLELLTLAADMDSLKGNVIEGIGDLLTKLPLDSFVEKNKIGEIDIQTRYYEPLLSAILADTTKKVILRWPNKMDEVTPEIRPDAIISTLVQLKFGRHLGYGEVKPGDDSTTTQSLCVDTLKLTVLSRNTCLKNEHPILAFQVNGFQLIFYVTQRIHHRFYTMIEIGRVKEKKITWPPVGNRPVLKTPVTRVITYIVLGTVTVITVVYMVFRKPTLSVPKSKKRKTDRRKDVNDQLESAKNNGACDI
ncbi:hypothetical protein K501DRAFT_335044 [Backusella circina FSU 941]|nr:hypothetical protein K501DRAFT_335044 [Backusella circina FSU 941]